MLKATAVFSNDMVLQRNKNIKIWGRYDGIECVYVAIKELGVKVKATVSGGRWEALLPPQNACGSCTVEITAGQDKIEFTNVAIGEVWLCGGQSNMELEIQNAKDGKELLKTLTPECGVRFYYTQKQGMLCDEFYKIEENTCWQTASEDNSKAWSAVGLHFGLKLAKELGVTVGLIGCNWGGTSASAWVDKKTLESDVDTAEYLEPYNKAIEGKTYEECIAEYDEYVEYDRKWNEKSAGYYKEHPNAEWSEVCEFCGENKWPGPMGPKNPFRPCGLYETMLMRVCPYTLRGFTYYQGESDDHKPNTYYKLFTKLITLWREKWGDDELPFLVVQLPMFKYAHDPDYKHWCKIRDAQMRAFKTVKNTGIAVISDCGELNNIHPLDKKPVGERLALQADKLVYSMDVSAFGPMYKSYEIKDGGIELSFDYAENGFDVKGEPVGFELAGEDKKFVEVTPEIRGDKVFLKSAEIDEPKYARYDWSNWVAVSLYGKNGIPLAPFRTSRDDEE